MKQWMIRLMALGLVLSLSMHAYSRVALPYSQNKVHNTAEKSNLPQGHSSKESIPVLQASDATIVWHNHLEINDKVSFFVENSHQFQSQEPISPKKENNRFHFRMVYLATLSQTVRPSQAP